MKKLLNKKGFTLAELLIVVAIIAVLVAIAIPIFTTQLEKSREAVDAANIRAAYAQVISNYISNGDETPIPVELKQEEKGWANKFDFPKNLEATEDAEDPEKGGTATISINEAGTGATCDILLSSSSSGGSGD